MKTLSKVIIKNHEKFSKLLIMSFICMLCGLLKVHADFIATIAIMMVASIVIGGSDE